MLVTDYNSVKFRWLSLAAILCVVLGHCHLDGGCLERVLIPVFAQWHVPWFFVLSGMFLHFSCERYSCSSLLLKKMKSLCMPYLIWCAWGILVLQQPWSGIDAEIGLTSAFPTGNVNLWYLHCLIVFTVVALILFGCVRHWGRKTIWGMAYCVFFVVCFCLKIWTLVGTPTSPFYFAAGFLLAPRLLSPRNGERSNWKLFSVVSLVAIFLRVMWFKAGATGAVEIGLRSACVVSMITAVWVGYDVLAQRQILKRFPEWLNVVFFVYCFHGPVLFWLRKWWIGLFGHGDLACDVGMLALWLIVSILSFSVGNIMRVCSPRIYHLLSGGR